MARGWSDIRADLVPFAGNLADLRAQAVIVDAVRRGDFLPLDFEPVRLRHPSLPITLDVEASAHAIEIGRPGDSQRVALSHRSTQAVADLLGLLVPTPDVIDALANQSPVHVEPHESTGTVLATLNTQAEHHALLSKDADRGAWDNVKAWVTHPRLWSPGSERWGKMTAINYGWHTKGAAQPQGTPGPKLPVSGALNVYQEPGGAHDVGHTDRSQLGIGFIKRDGVLTTAGVPVLVDIETVARTPGVYKVISRSGLLPEMRHPWLSVCRAFGEGSCDATGGGGGSAPPPGGSAPPTKPPPRMTLARFAPVVVMGAALGYLVTR